MKLLHTADWHVGKTLKGRNRLEEQRAVVWEVVRTAIDHQVDAVLIAGDLYDTSAPSAEAQSLVFRALLRLAREGIEVIAIAGNHDHARSFEALRPLLRVAGVECAGEVRAAVDGGVYRFRARSTGEEAVVAVLPFLSRRHVMRAAEIVADTPAGMAGRYDDAVRQILGHLTAGFGPSTVNLVLAHLTCTGGLMGGGEREAQSILEYHVPASAFPVETHYVALGHLHRRQVIHAACPVHYCGSPLAVDFGEQENAPVVCLVEVSPATPARVTDVPITSGRRLRTVTGSVSEVVSGASTYGEDYLRVWVTEPARAGLRDEIVTALPNAIEVRIHPDFITRREAVPIDYATRTPSQLFVDYCTQVGVADERVSALFDELSDETRG